MIAALFLAALLAPADQPVIVLAAPPPPPTVPSAIEPGVRTMIEAALAGKDPGTAEAILRLARETNPAAAREIDSIRDAWHARLAERSAAADKQRRERLAAAGPFDNWKGQVEIGASRSTGNTDSFGLYASIGLERDGLEWRHKVTARADFQQTNDETTTKRALLAWQPNYRLSERGYSFGLVQYEYDPLLGYDSRYTLGGGLGYAVIAESKVKLDLEGGPAVRLTNPVIGPSTTSLAGRASLNLGWKVAPALELKQNGAFYYEKGDTSANAQTALDAKLIGDLKARLSYNIQYERNAPPGADSIDTTSRATLIYSF